MQFEQRGIVLHDEDPPPLRTHDRRTELLRAGDAAWFQDHCSFRKICRLVIFAGMAGNGAAPPAAIPRLTHT